MSTKTKFRSRILDKSRFDEIMDQVRPVQEDLKPQRKQYKLPDLRSHAKKAVNAFLNTDTTQDRYGQYFIDGPFLYYRACKLKGSYSRQLELFENTVAYRINEDTIIGNSSVLDLLTKQDRWNRRAEVQTEVQEVLSGLIPMVPFNVFEEAGLNMKSFEFVDKGPEETVIRQIDSGKVDKKTKKKIFVDEEVHFTGACLFKFKKEDGDYEYFLFDLDRNEIKHKLFNPFVAKLPVPAQTIAEAYEALKPKEVKEAEAEGTEVQRQGEWFFIKADTEDDPKKTCDKLEEDNSWNGLKKGDPVPMDLRAGDNRPNTAQYGIEAKMYVSGKIEHTGREHKTIVLKGWYRAIPNTAIQSFTIVGDID